MAARAIWKGVLSFGDVRLPVKLYSAAEDRDVHFRLLHAADGQPVEQRMVHPESGEVVPRDQVRRGLEIEPGTIRMVEPEILAQAEEPSREIEITRFVPRQAIGDAWYERPYWLGPDGDVLEDYFALAQVLADEELEGVARWTMRKKSYAGALGASDGYLVLPTLRYAGEVVSTEALEPPAGADPSKRERQMAEQLVAMLSDDFRPAEFRNRHRDRVRELVEAKAEGRLLPFPRPERPSRTVDLTDALERSLERTERERRRAS